MESKRSSKSLASELGDAIYEKWKANVKGLANELSVAVAKLRGDNRIMTTHLDGVHKSIRMVHDVYLMDIGKMEARRRDVQWSPVTRAEKFHGLGLAATFSLLETMWTDMVQTAMGRGLLPDVEDDYNLKARVEQVIASSPFDKPTDGIAWEPYADKGERITDAGARRQLHYETNFVTAKLDAAVQARPDFARFLYRLCDKTNNAFDWLGSIVENAVLAATAADLDKTASNFAFLLHSIQTWQAIHDTLCGGAGSGHAIWRDEVAPAKAALKDIVTCWQFRNKQDWSRQDAAEAKAPAEAKTPTVDIAHVIYYQADVVRVLAEMAGPLYDPSTTPLRNYRSLTRRGVFEYRDGGKIALDRLLFAPLGTDFDASGPLLTEEVLAKAAHTAGAGAGTQGKVRC